MTAFNAALAVLAADPNLGVGATYRAAGTGAGIPLRVLRSSPDRVADGFGTSILQATDIRVAGRSARFGVSEARWSLYPMAGSAVRLRRQILAAADAELVSTYRRKLAAALY